MTFRALAPAVLLFGGSLALTAQGGPFAASIEHDAIRYSSAPLADPISRLQGKLQSGSVRLTSDGESGYLRSLLDALAIPVESQTLVFSETSADAPLITPKNPRAIYFNDDVAVGWTRGSTHVEIAAQDPRQGTIFYTLDQQVSERPAFTRDASCLLCHQTTDTAGVPGWLVFTVFSVPRDKYSYATGAAIDHRTAIGERWGGWYVTGKAADGHLGNIPQPDGIESARRNPGPRLDTVREQFDTRGYLSPLSDIVALMVLDHQAQMMNLITRMDWEARVAFGDRASAAGTESTPPVPERVREAAVALVDYLLFVDEAPLSGPIEGAAGYRTRFEALGPRDGMGRSLRELDLTRRLLKYPCSYMIYSAAFDAMAPAAKRIVYERLWQVLSGAERDPVYNRLARADRQALVEILRATKSDLPSSFGTPVRE